MKRLSPAALTYFLLGGFTMLRALRGLVSPTALPEYDKVWNEFLFQYGGPISGVLLGGLLLAAGVLTQRSADPAQSTDELHFISEAEIPLAPVMAGFLLWLAIITTTSVLPYTGERGIEPGQLALVPPLFIGFMYGAWFLLHYRRLTILHRAARTFEISYGKPWAALRLRYQFSDYQTVAIEEVQRARGSVYRLVASGPKGSKLITFTFNPESAKACAQNIAQVTGWSIAPAAGP